jgi:Tfp pilus assembly protein FimV
MTAMVAIAHPTPRRLRPRTARPAPLHIAAVRPQRPDAATFRRRRLAAFGGLLVVLAIAVGLVSAVLAPRATVEPHPAATISYVVQPGDSLWSIAGELAPGEDLRPIVDALEAANGGTTLVAGQRLLVDLP